ncbi:RNA polymerase II transcription factor-like protein [Lophiostoma macrostomum CBS 122681]|uniref:RNA polymerase II transcription factor-like protein n=1 Tax=Lophiostoma macrostomum CBS 122681 TaxID=1314788 RepID=A0A6A6T1C9_9PLEO|nr:RNA polymerase II transcription factor-like protein [Lophiostoma macrostomum CBS 122681]
MSQAPAQYKKQDGIISLSDQGARAVLWKPNSGALHAVTIPVTDITNLQQTPVTAPKASIRISAQETHTFTLTSAAARDNQQAITGTLRKWIEASKSVQGGGAPVPTAPPAENGNGQSASMVMAQTASSATATARAEDDSFDDAKLLRDAELQRSLLSSNPALRHRFEQALGDKPDSITINQFNSQFWSTRLHNLRSHAAERAQGAGTYNVLSVVKPQEIDGGVKLNITKEQIQLIFAQHPLVKRVYNENVPPLKESEFWSRFFFSRLLKKLKGMKITDSDNVDPKLDKYLNLDDDPDFARQLDASAVPRFIDVEGNEQNHSQRLGNRADWTMQPNSYDKVPILRTLNRMSEKMMEYVPPSDGDRHGPAGMDEDTYKELQLRDLQRADDDNRVVLKIKDQGQLFAASQGLHTSSSAATYAKRTPAQVLSAVQRNFGGISGSNGGDGLDLQAAIGVVDDDSSSDEESASNKKIRIGSRSSRVAATLQINKAIRKRHLHNDDYLLSQNAASSEQAAQLGLSQSVFDTLTMTHNTTVEFLHYFWTVYFSGDPDRAIEIGKLVETLDKSLDRIKAVADSAEAERTAKVEKLVKDNETYTQRTGRRRKFDANSVTGGAKVVNNIASPLIRAIGSAKEQFEKALREQMGHSIA